MALLLLLAMPWAAIFPAHVQAQVRSVSGSPDRDLKVHRFEHYEVHSRLPKREVDVFGKHMDRVFEEYQRRFREYRSADVRQMPLYLFAEQEEYNQFLRRFGVDATNTAGMFFVKPEGKGLATFVRGRPRGVVFSVLQHEGFHQFAFDAIGHDLPIWVNEGLAQYFEDGILTDKQMHLGLANARRVASVKQALDAGEAVDFDRLLAMTPREWSATVVRGGREGGLLYDQSWSIVYMLIHGQEGKYRQAFEQYLQAVSKGTPGPEAFARAFGDRDTRPFRRAWEAFARSHEPDGLSTAVARMQFLGHGLQYLLEQQNQSPRDLDDLQGMLARVRFSSMRTEGTVQTEYRSTDEENYTYARGRGQPQPFRLLPPEKSRMPARLTAPGLSPQPTLAWERDEDGRLVQTLTFK